VRVVLDPLLKLVKVVSLLGQLMDRGVTIIIDSFIIRVHEVGLDVEGGVLLYSSGL